MAWGRLLQNTFMLSIAAAEKPFKLISVKLLAKNWNTSLSDLYFVAPWY